MSLNSSNSVLNHLSFPSENIEATAGFFEKYLGCVIEHKMPEAWLLKHGDIDIVVESFSTKENATDWPQNFHFGLELKTLDDVKSAYEVFKKDGVKLDTEVFNNGRGSRFFCRTECDILIEINTRQDMNPDLWKKSK